MSEMGQSIIGYTKNGGNHVMYQCYVINGQIVKYYTLKVFLNFMVQTLMQ